MRKECFSTSYSLVTMRAVSLLTLSSSACTPVLIFRTNMIVLILLLRARVLSHNPKVQSPWFDARCVKIILFSDFPIVGAVRAKV